MRKLCFSSEECSPSSSSSASIFQFPFGSSSSRSTFADSVMNRTVGMAEPIIMKWNPDTTTVIAVTSMFYENRREAEELIQWVSNLKKAMRLVVMENTNPEKLVHAQNLMQIAMKRLQKEFYQILSMNRAHLDPDSVSTRSSRVSTRSSTSGYEDDDDDIRIVNKSISEVEVASRVAMADLRLIAECMISCGYEKECVKVYKIIRKSIVDEGIYSRLGVEKFKPSNIHKMNWEGLDIRIKSWLNALETAVKTLFDGERMLCDHVFASSDSIRESCFTEITRGGAMILFEFPENVVKNSRNFPEKVFRSLDMYAGISNLLPEIESIFSFDSTANIKSKALTSLIALRENVKAALNDFESAIQKESSKTPVAGAGIHDLTIDSMKYLSLLADYRNILKEIFPESPPPEQNLLPESYLGLIYPQEPPPPPISFKIAWLILSVICKLDAKSKFFKDISLSYLFLANNLQYVVVKVRTSNLRHMLGDKWLSLQEYKVKQFASSYEHLGWSHVIESLPSDPSSLTSYEQVKETFKKFNLTFDEACDKQSLCVVTDNRLRDDIKESLARKIFYLYREFYNTHERTMEGDRNSAFLVRFTPDDVGHRLSDLFFFHVEAGNSLSFNSSAQRQSATR
ncbi:exocyst complex component EXO70H1-like [Primulina huaijiensis]|uniref:exocyst complex component EXO70H1-like n=1 Tax=Primulina huaijiensis TaxID=1492673 RepID=UPI003CC741FC